MRRGKKTCSDAVLGNPTNWSSDDEGWVGQHQGMVFSLAYEMKRIPSEELIHYAQDVLGDAAWLAATLEEAKRNAKNEFESYYDVEINGLHLGEIHFYRHKGQLRIIADLEGGKDDRLWRMEFAERHCEGIGFDR